MTIFVYPLNALDFLQKYYRVAEQPVVFEQGIKSMSVSFFSIRNFQKILNFSSETHTDKQHHGFTYWLEWWLMVDKKRTSCSIHCNNFQTVEKDLSTWFKYGWVAGKLEPLFFLNAAHKKGINRLHYSDILKRVLSWFRVINRLQIECPADLEQDLIKLLGLSLALLNCFTAVPADLVDAYEASDDSNLSEEDKIRILQGYYYWLELKYSRSPRASDILKNHAATLRPVHKTFWKTANISRSIEDSLSLHDHLGCSLASKSAGCHLFLEYFLAYYKPGDGLRAKREIDRQEGTDFLMPAFDFMRKYQGELEALDDCYTYCADDIPAPHARLS